MALKIDLKPLSEETIQEMGYTNHDLWMVKIEAVIFGPYETESLKHYVHENEKLFETAFASKADEDDWKPFWELTRFQRRKPQITDSEFHEGPFWLLHAGLKVGPFSKQDIEKKIEMDLLLMTDHISIDNGASWPKIYQISGLDRRHLSPDELPLAPSEGSFQEARLAVLEKLNVPHLNNAEVAAELAFEGQEAGKILQFKVDEIPLKPQQASPEISTSMRWAFPAVAVILVSLTTGSYFLLGTQDETTLVMKDIKEKSPSKNSRGHRSGGAIPSPSFRSPASVGYNRPAPSVSRYPTYTETHDQFPEAQDYHVDPIDQPVNDADQPTQEHSLVSQQQGTPEENSLDNAMNGSEQPQPQPVVEEASDF
jgi:hypothetical protein